MPTSSPGRWSTSWRCCSRHKKLGPARFLAPTPPRYATRGNLSVSRPDGEKGKTPSMGGLCAIRAQHMLNAACSRRSGKSVGLQKLRCGSGSLFGSLLGDCALELADLERQLVVT